MTNERRHQLDLWALDEIKPTYAPYHETSEMVYYLSAWVFSLAKRSDTLKEPHANACMAKVVSIIPQIELHERIFEHHAKISVEIDKLMSSNKDLESKSKTELIEIIKKLDRLFIGLGE